jgi:hypothetical protein
MGHVTTDTEATMNKFGTLLEKESDTDHGYCTDHGLNSTASVAYKYKLLDDNDEEDKASEETVNMGDATIKVGKGILAKCRKMGHLFKASTQKAQRLEAVQNLLATTEDSILLVEHYVGEKPKDLIQDVITRWWSTYDMIERLLYLRQALSFMDMEGDLKSSSAKKNDPSLMLKDSEWDVLEGLKFVLGPFKEAQLILESQEIVTSSLVLWLLNLVNENMETIISNDHMDGLDHLSDISESLIELVEEMKTDFDTRWGDDLAGSPFKRQVTRGHKKRQVGVHPDLLKAHALDPRYKNLDLIQDDENKNELYDAILDDMVKAKKQQLKLRKDAPTTTVDEDLTTGGEATEATTSSSRPAKKRKKGNNLFLRSTLRRTDGTAASSSSHAFNSDAEIRRQCEAELIKYRQAPQIPMWRDAEMSEMADPLVWWEQHCLLYEILWLLAKYYLAIPATSALSERCFSAAGRILSAQRAGSTSSDNFEETFFVKRNLHLIA